jgi:hypothetical protein
MDDLAVNDDPRRRYDAIARDRGKIGDLLNAAPMPSRSASVCTIPAAATQRLQPEPSIFTFFIDRLQCQANRALNR